MKALVLFLLSSGAFGQETYHLLGDVRTLEREDDHYKLTLWQDPRTFIIPRPSEITRCLDESLRTSRQVALQFDSDENVRKCYAVEGRSMDR